MDLNFITPHLISGYIPVAAALILYHSALHAFGIKQAKGHVLLTFVFCFYLVGILTVTGICLKGSFSPRIVYIPFIDMIKGPKETILNIILFIPMGFFLPLLYEKHDGLKKTAIVGFLVSLSVEIAQLFGFGTTDINDLITNTFGACLGYGIYRLIKKAVPKQCIEKAKAKGSQCNFELPLFWFGSMIIMLTFQTSIFHALFQN